MQRTFGVALNPETQLMHCMGIKAALSILPHCFVDPGDLVLWPVPSYPIGGVHARFCGGTLHELPLLADNGFLPDLASLTPAVAQAAKVLFLNYPHNPTGAQATLAFFQQAVALAHRYGWLIIQDAAYAGLVHPGQKPLSILSVPGALEVAVELHSLSKPYNMTGWRLGWVCGAAHAVKAYTHVKEQTDSGQFLPIQWGGIAALQDDAFPQACAKLYAQRLADLLHVLGHSGWHLPVERRPRAGFFLYMPAPAQATHSSGQCVSFATAQDCTEWLITELGIVAVPWDELQPSVRFAVTWGQDEVDFIQQLAARLQGWSFHGLLSGPYAS
jgi:LL-diaminopimelate aminotransferase